MFCWASDQAEKVQSLLDATTLWAKHKKLVVQRNVSQYKFICLNEANHVVVDVFFYDAAAAHILIEIKGIS